MPFFNSKGFVEPSSADSEPATALKTLAAVAFCRSERRLRKGSLENFIGMFYKESQSFRMLFRLLQGRSGIGHDSVNNLELSLTQRVSACRI